MFTYNSEICFLVELSIGDEIFYLTNVGEDILVDDKLYLNSITSLHLESVDLFYQSESNTMNAVFDELIIQTIQNTKYCTIKLFSMLGSQMYQIFNGIVTDINVLSKNEAKLTFASKAKKLNKECGNFFSPICRAEFGDDKCKKDLTSYTFGAKILEIINLNEFKLDIQNPDGTFDNGIFIYQNFRSKIYNYVKNTVTISSPVLEDIKINDTILLIMPCNKTLKECIKYDNIVNFRGEPFIFE